MSVSYEALIEDLIAAQAEIFGAEAVNMARQVDGLTLADDGRVERLDGEGVEAVDELVSVYVADLGGAATVTLKSVAEGHADRLALPQALQ